MKNQVEKTAQKRSGVAMWKARQRQGYDAYQLRGGCKLIVLHPRVVTIRERSEDGTAA